VIQIKLSIYCEFAPIPLNPCPIFFSPLSFPLPDPKSTALDPPTSHLLIRFPIPYPLFSIPITFHHFPIAFATPFTLSPFHPFTLFPFSPFPLSPIAFPDSYPLPPIPYRLLPIPYPLFPIPYPLSPVPYPLSP